MKKKSTKKANDKKSTVSSDFQNWKKAQDEENLRLMLNRGPTKEKIHAVQLRKYTKGYCTNLKTFERDSSIKKTQLSKGDHLDYLNGKLRKYQEATNYLSGHNESELVDVYHEIGNFIMKEIEIGLKVDAKNEASSNRSGSEYNSQIFTSEAAFKLFEILKDKLVRQRYYLADFSFVYWQMKDDGFLHDITPVNFKNFISKFYKIELDKIKTRVTSRTETKFALYSSCKAQIE